jgi:3-methyladenine DNA glycosylase Mpg
MLIFSAIIAIILVENVLGAKNRGQYIELDNTTTEAYLCIEEDNCNVVYICKKREETFFHDKLYDCYNRNEHTDMNFVPNNRNCPDNCNIKGYVNIKSDQCCLG